MSGHINKKTVITIAACAAAALLLGGGYIWYSGNYAGRNRLQLAQEQRADTNWRNIASSHGIVGGYLWSRTTELMIKNSSDGVMIPSSYMIAGRLTSQPAESSEVYLLSDQALLLKNYVRRGDLINATSLKDRVNDVLVSEDADIRSLCDWLDAYLEYYASYGSKSDYEKICEIAGYVFDGEGNIRSEQLSVATYVAGDFLSLADEDAVTGSVSTLEQEAGEEGNAAATSFTGWRLSAIDLELIYDLENNGMIPEGTFDRYCAIVEGGRIADDIPYYAYAFYYSSSGEVEYVSSYDKPAAVNMEESLRTLTNLFEVGRGDLDVYRNIKNSMINGQTFYDSYYFMTGGTGGDEDLDMYSQVMLLALVAGDSDLYDSAASRIGSRIATYSSSPALNMVYRPVGERFVFNAAENLTVSLVVN